MKRFLAPLLLLPMLAACSTIMSGTTQSVLVNTPFVDGAKCTLTDSKKGTWYLPATPGSVTVNKGDGPMHVVCTKAGYETGIASADDELQPATFGNIILGGGIGVFVDAADGAAQKYPDAITVWMKPLKWASEKQRKQWESAKATFDADLKKKADDEAAAQKQTYQNR